MEIGSPETLAAGRHCTADRPTDTHHNSFTHPVYRPTVSPGAGLVARALDLRLGRRRFFLRPDQWRIYNFWAPGKHSLRALVHQR